MTTIKIKEQNLIESIKELVDAALEVDRKNKEKICNFIVALVRNGGHKSHAAMEAGYGPEKDKDGNKRSYEDRQRIASVEAVRLLKNARIREVYDRIMASRFAAKIFTETITKEQIMYILCDIGMRIYASNPKQGITAFKEFSILAGYYATDEKTDLSKAVEQINAIYQGMDIKKRFIEGGGKDERKEKRLN